MTEPDGSLTLPVSVMSEPGGGELLRVWMSGSGVTVVLRTDVIPAAAWGLILVDVARHAAAAYGQQGHTSPQAALRDMVQIFTSEFGQPTDTIRPAT